jgi:hypothetical protein
MIDDLGVASSLAGRLQAGIAVLRAQLQQEAATATLVEEAVQATSETATTGNATTGDRLVDILV